MSGGRSAAADGQVLLDARGLVRSFGDQRAVDGIDLALVRGEVHALVGLNGAGKSTLLRLLLGMLRPDAGTVTLRGDDGCEVDVRHAPAAAWGRVGHLVGAPPAYPELTVAEAVRAAARLRGLRSAEAAAAGERVVDDLGLRPWNGRRTGTLSTGNRQRLGLACAMVHRPDVLVLDEPTTGLDPAGVLRVRRQLLAAADRGAGIVLSSHHLDEIARVAHRISVVHGGRVVGSLPPGEADLERRFFDLVYRAEGLDASGTGWWTA